MMNCSCSVPVVGVPIVVGRKNLIQSNVWMNGLVGWMDCHRGWFSC